MDTLPPQAPPAIASSEQQAVLDTLQRLIAVHGWLAEQQEGLPTLPPPTGDLSKGDYLNALDAFWTTGVMLSPGAPPVSRREAFATQWAAVMRDEAQLRAVDGTLDPADASLAAEFARREGVADGAEARELMVGGQAYAGAMALERQDGRTLLFLPDRGWERFDRASAMHEAIEHRLRLAWASGRPVAGLSLRDIDLTTTMPLVSTQAIAGAPFEQLARQVQTVQREQSMGAWDDFQAGLLDQDDLIYTLEYLTHPAASLDLGAILGLRESRLRQKLDEERLAPVPPAVRNGWHAAFDAYGETIRAVAQLRAEQNIQPPHSLADFTREALRPALVAMGVHDEPDTLRVEVTPTPLNIIEGWLHGREPVTIPLADLALQNASALVQETYRLVRFDASVLPLDSLTIRTLVRAADVGRRYPEHLQEALGSPDDAHHPAKSLAMDLQQARMRFEAADARVSYYAAGEPRAFINDHAERGYRWVEAALDSPTPTGRRKVEGHEIVVRQLTYRGVPVSDLLAFGVRAKGGVFRVVLYTPDAPDGRSFREFGDRAEAATDFLLNPIFETWLLDRLPADFTQHFANGARHFKRDSAIARANWVLGPAGNATSQRQTQLDEPFDERDIHGDFLQAWHDTAVLRRVRDVLALTRTTDAADWAQRWALLTDASTHPVGELGGHLALELVQSVPRALQAAWRAYDNIKAGDHGQAFVDATASYVNALDIAGIGATAPLRAFTASIRAARGARSLVATRRVMPTHVARFEARFRAHGVRSRGADQGNDGIVRIDGKPYVEHAGDLYHVRYDTATRGWRLTRPGTLDSEFTGPTIRRSATGAWQLRPAAEIGLPGGFTGGAGHGRGARRDAAAHQHFIRLRAAAALELETANMTPQQLNASFRELILRVGPVRAGNIVLNAAAQANVGTAAQLILAVDRSAWRHALDVGRGRLPGLPPPVAPRLRAMNPGAGRADAAAVAAGVESTAYASLPGAVSFGNRAVRELTASEWPDTLWHYVGGDALPAPTAYLNLQQTVQPATGVTGVPLTSQPASGPSSVRFGSISRSANGAAAVPSSDGWVRVDLNALRAMYRDRGLPDMHLFRARDAAAQDRYYLQPGPSGADPLAQRAVVVPASFYLAGRGSP